MYNLEKSVKKMNERCLNKDDSWFNRWTPENAFSNSFCIGDGSRASSLCQECEIELKKLESMEKFEKIPEMLEQIQEELLDLKRQIKKLTQSQ